MLYMSMAGTISMLNCVPFMTNSSEFANIVHPLTVALLLMNARCTRFSATDSLTNTQYLPTYILLSPLIVLCVASDLS